MFDFTLLFHTAFFLRNLEEAIKTLLSLLKPHGIRLYWSLLVSGWNVKDTALPSRSTAQRMKIEVGYLVKLRLACQWKQQADSSAIFQTDKTTKGPLE